MNTILPTLTTPRLLLRPFAQADAPRVQELASEFAIADTTCNIPHPYPDGAAEQWINTHAERWAQRQALTLAITRRAEGDLLGAISLHFNDHFDRAEMGYWLGQPYWKQGYTSEAAQALVAYGFEQLGLQRIFAYHFVRNPASGRVMRKAGMSYEGTLRGHTKKWDRYEDLSVRGILRGDYEAQRDGHLLPQAE